MYGHLNAQKSCVWLNNFIILHKYIDHLTHNGDASLKKNAF